MPTVEERVARLESLAEGHDERLEAIYELVNSGPHVPWEQCIRGKLHRIMETLATADKLAEAAREVRRSRRQSLSRAERVLLALCALAAAAAPYVVLVLHN